MPRTTKIMHDGKEIVVRIGKHNLSRSLRAVARINKRKRR